MVLWVVLLGLVVVGGLVALFWFKAQLWNRGDD